jgi:hypothetical protein
VNSQESLAEVFVHIADTLVADFDIIDFLQHLCDRCVELLGVDAAGLLLADPRASSRSRLRRVSRRDCSSCSSCSPGRGRASTVTGTGRRW